jgi:hypothetical protein
MVAFQLGGDDAQVLSRQLAKHVGQIETNDLANLPKYTAYVRLLVDGTPSRPFSMVTFPPDPITEDRTVAVSRASQRRYGRPTEKVREDIGRELLRK